MNTLGLLVAIVLLLKQLGGYAPKAVKINPAVSFSAAIRHCVLRDAPYGRPQDAVSL
jgi:hypothetical protein